MQETSLDYKFLNGFDIFGKHEVDWNFLCQSFQLNSEKSNVIVNKLITGSFDCQFT